MSEITQTPTSIPLYSHRQHAPLWLLLVAVAIGFFYAAWTVPERQVAYFLLAPLGTVMVILAAAFQYLLVEDQGDQLLIGFGPLPLFRTRFRYDQITHVEVGTTTWIEGWGIHLSPRGGWVWNLWGWDCVVLRGPKRTLRVGTDDAEALSKFLQSRLPEVPSRT